MADLFSPKVVIDIIDKLHSEYNSLEKHMFPLTDKKANEIIRDIRNKKSAFWEKERKKSAIFLFQKASHRIPAYKDFLKKNKVKPEKIKTFEDFKLVPITSKENYLRRYPLESLIWGGSLKNKQLAFCATSGSTGEPFYFPRSYQLDWESSIIHQIFLENNHQNLRQPILVIIGFGMGVWIGGLITYKAFEIAALKSSYSVSIIAPGINKEEIFKAFKNLAPHYKQVVFVGYPPFVKDVLDEAVDRGINIKKLNLRLLFAAEPFTEKFRDYLAKKADLRNIYLDTLNVYGTADIGTMAYETPTAILIRRLALQDKKLFQDIFSDIIKTPTLCQYNPLFTIFESIEGQVILTGNSTIPLIRYSVGDNGGAYGFDELEAKLENAGIDIYKEAKKVGISDYIYKLPFVYVYERSNFAVKLHLRDIYPEIIRDVMIAEDLSKLLTCKFAIATKYNKQHDQYLEVNLELRKGKKANNAFKKMISKRILKALYLRTTGPGNPDEFIKRPNLIKLIFWPAEHNLYFKPGVKQKWTH